MPERYLSAYAGLYPTHNLDTIYSHWIVLTLTGRKDAHLKGFRRENNPLSWITCAALQKNTCSSHWLQMWPSPGYHGAGAQNFQWCKSTERLSSHNTFRQGRSLRGADGEKGGALSPCCVRRQIKRRWPAIESNESNSTLWITLLPRTTPSLQISIKFKWLFYRSASVCAMTTLRPGCDKGLCV